MKSERNKTIDMTVEEGREYLEKCLKADELKEGSDLPLG